MEKKSSLEKMNTALELLGFAEQCIRNKVLRKNPNATENEIETALKTWYQTRPGAEHGDFSGPYIIRKK